MSESNHSKRWGIGSLSFFISIFSIMFSFTFQWGKYVGEHILDAIGVVFPISIISLILFCISIFIGYKYKHNYLAKSGRIISIIFVVLMIVLTISNLFS